MSWEMPWDAPLSDHMFHLKVSYSFWSLFAFNDLPFFCYFWFAIFWFFIHDLPFPNCQFRFAISELPFRIAILDLPFWICHFKLAIFDLPFSICRFRFAIFDLPFSMCNLWFAISDLPSSNYHLGQYCANGLNLIFSISEIEEGANNTAEIARMEEDIRPKKNQIASEL